MKRLDLAWHPAKRDLDLLKKMTVSIAKSMRKQGLKRKRTCLAESGQRACEGWARHAVLECPPVVELALESALRLA